MKEKKQIENKRKTGKAERTVFAEYEFDWTTRENLKHLARKHKKPRKSARKLQKLN